MKKRANRRGAECAEKGKKTSFSPRSLRLCGEVLLWLLLFSTIFLMIFFMLLPPVLQLGHKQVFAAGSTISSLCSSASVARK
jgi:hypothetical protein